MKKITLLFLVLLISSLGYSQGINYKKGAVLRTNSEQSKSPLQTPRSMTTVDCGQETLSNDFETSLGSLKNYIIANDFVVDEEMGVFSLEAITFHAFVEPGGTIADVDFMFYEDSGNGPDNVITSLVDVEATSVEVVGEYEDEDGINDVLEVYVELDEPLTFESEEGGAVYWMGVQVPNYGGSSIGFELISELETSTGTFVFLAGGWHGVEDLFGVIRDGVMTLSGTCSASDECSEVSAGILEGPDSVCALAEFMISPVDATIGVSGVLYTWEQSSIDEENWTVIEDATSLNLTMEEGIDVPTQFRFVIACEFGNTDISEVSAVNLNSAEECYCEPEYTLGCEDGDTINQVMIEDEAGEVIFQNDSDCSETGYTDYTQDLEAPELMQGNTYTMNVTSESELTDEDDVRIWLDFNQDGVFAEDEEIGNTAGGGLDAEGEFSFQFTIPENLELGAYRIRVRMAWLGGDDIEPCINKSYGEAEDYAVEIIENLNVENFVFNQLSFYPNPVENQLNLRAKTPIENLKVYNILGQEVLQESPNTLETQLQTQNLPTGIYLIQVTLQGVQKSYKIIKK